MGKCGTKFDATDWCVLMLKLGQYHATKLAPIARPVQWRHVPIWKEMTLGEIAPKNIRVKHRRALLLRFLTLLLQNGGAKGRLKLIGHVRQAECGCAQTNSAVSRHPMCVSPNVRVTHRNVLNGATN